MQAIMRDKQLTKRLRFSEEVEILENKVVKEDERVGNFGSYEELLSSLKDDLDVQEETEMLFTGYSDQDMGFEIEPFNMDKEKTEGYFDQQGHYIQFRRFKQQEEDAWWQQVQDEDYDRVSGAALQQPELFISEDIPEMSKDQAKEYKTEILSILQNGETVLDALRRLGQQPNLQQQGRKKSRKAWASDESKKEFHRLVELADMLLHNGDYNVYSTPKYEHAVPDEKSLDAITISDEQQDMQIQESSQQQSGDEFVVDKETGWLYNSQQGWYYDTQNQLFGDASTGLWYKYEDGDYRCIYS